ncbi:MAG: ATP-binding cassette domain-containing protein [Erysipelothrix sp.]
MIEVTNLTKKYGKFYALDQVSVDVHDGRVTAIIGENGSGKTTLLNMMGRLTEETEGIIRYNHRDIKEFKSREFAQKVAILKQNNMTNLRLTVYDLVSFGRFPHNQHKLTDEDELIILESLSFMGCMDLKDKYIDQLSGGQLQRVYIAMILVQDTDYIFLDEPLNNLDLKHAHELMALIQSLAIQRSKTVVIVMHDLNMVYRYVDDVIALKHGRLIANGAVDDVLNESVLHRIYDMKFTIQSCTEHKVAFIE